MKAELDDKVANDYRLQEDSAAKDAGVTVTSEWPDVLQMKDKGKPDIGALHLGAKPLQVGRIAKE